MSTGLGPLLPDGTSLAGWRVVRRLGAGGMAEVYLATHPRLPRQDVLKVMRPWLAQDPSFHRKFRAEADRMSALSGHEHIVTIFDQLEEDGLLFLVLQYAPGGDLRAMLSSAGRLPLMQVLDIGRQVAGALDAGHALGIIHRDVKPENVLLKGPSVNESVLLADFGISFLAEGSAQQSTLTQSLMTPVYAAPEQFELQPLDGRSDQYSLACMLYELLRGQPPFVAPTPPALMKAHLFDPVPPLPRDLGLPQAVDTVFARALAKRAPERFPSCTAFVEGLRQAAVVQRPQPPSQQDRPPQTQQQWMPQQQWSPQPQQQQQPPQPPPPPREASAGSGRWQTYGPPPLIAAAAPNRPSGARGAGRVLAQIAFFALPVVTFGMGAWAPAAWALAVRRARLELMVFLGLLAVSAVGLVLAGVGGDREDAGGSSSLADAGGGVLVLAIVLGVVTAVLFRRRVFGGGDGSPLASDPAVAAVLAGRQRRAELRALAIHDQHSRGSCGSADRIFLVRSTTQA